MSSRHNAKMERAKKAISLLARYAKNINEPQELEQLLQLLNATIQKNASPKTLDTFKNVSALSALLFDLNRKAVKVKYSKARSTFSQERNKLIMKLHEEGFSYQKIADKLAHRGNPISAVAVFKIVRKTKALKAETEGAENGN